MSLKGRNVLVTGGVGYIGTHTAKALAQAGATPVAFDNLSTGHREAALFGPLVVGDLANRHDIDEALRQHKIDAVIHFAARAYVGESMADPEGYFQANVTNSLNLLAAMRSAGVGHIVFSSSCTVYGPPEIVPITEQEPLKAMSPYGESKLFIERALHWYSIAYDVRWAALRYFNASGADRDGTWGEWHEPETHLIPLAMMAARREIDRLDVFGTDYPTQDGTAIRDYIHVGDLATAHLAALDRLLQDGSNDVFNLGTGCGHSVREIIDTVEHVSGRKVPYVNCPRRAGDPPALVADPSKAERLLGWKAEVIDIDQIVSSAWQWSEKLAALRPG
jgi:UDP-arabinose 4-epimerase